jgi:hypothetical protein
MTEVSKLEPAFVSKLAREMCKRLGKRTGMRQREREVEEILSSGFTLTSVDPNDLRAQGWSIMNALNVKELARVLVEKMLAEPEWTSCSSIDAVLRESVDRRFCIGPVEPNAPRFKIALRSGGDDVKFARFTGSEKADIEELQKRLVERLEAAGAQLFFWGGDASVFESAAEARLLGAEEIRQ